MSRTTREDASTKILGHKAAGKTASRLARESAAFRELWWRRGNETELGGWRDGSIEENGRVSDEIFTAALETHGHLLEDAPDLATGLLAWAAWLGATEACRKLTSDHRASAALGPAPLLGPRPGRESSRESRRRRVRHPSRRVAAPPRGCRVDLPRAAGLPRGSSDEPACGVPPVDLPRGRPAGSWIFRGAGLRVRHVDLSRGQPVPWIFRGTGLRGAPAWIFRKPCQERTSRPGRNALHVAASRSHRSAYDAIAEAARAAGTLPTLEAQKDAFGATPAEIWDAQRPAAAGRKCAIERVKAADFDAKALARRIYGGRPLIVEGLATTWTEARDAWSPEKLAARDDLVVPRPSGQSCLLRKDDAGQDRTRSSVS